jgi:predicted phage terminase large subunit-like protein
MKFETDELLLLKAKLQTDLLFFVRFFFFERNRTKFITSNHHKLICDELQMVHRGETKNISFNLPPRYSKTEIVSINFPAWCYAQNPQCNFLILSHSDTLVNDISAKIQSIIQSEMYKLLFGDYFKHEKNAKSLWYTQQGGCLHVASIYGQITGFGAGVLGAKGFSGAQVWDDLNKIKDVESETMREKVTTTINDTLLSRNNNGDDTPIINMQQRTHLNDASGYILAGKTQKKFKHVVLPIITNGIPLWELKHNNEQVESLRTGEETWHVFETQYMQNPTPKTGFMFPAKNLKRFTKSEINIDECLKLIYIDSKDTGKDSFAAPYIAEKDGMFYVYRVQFNKHPLMINEPLLNENILNENPATVVIETNREGGLLKNNLVQKFKKPTFLGVHNTVNKFVRINITAQFITNNFVFLVDSEMDFEYVQFFKQLTTYLAGGQADNDDAPDSVAGAAKYYFKPKQKSA